MLAVGLGPTEALKVIEDIPNIGIACYNSPDSVTLSGSEKAIEEARRRFSIDSIFIRKLITSGNAYHSNLMKEAGQHYENLLLQSLPQELKLTSNSNITMYSSVTQKPVDTVSLKYWRQNLESAVRFDTALQQLLESQPEVKIMVEIGPHSALAAPIKAIRAAVGYSSEQLLYLPSLKRNTDSVECLLNLVGSLFLSGFPIPISTVNSASNVGDAPGCFIPDLPTYQWEYSQDVMWAESRLSTDIRFRAYPHHDLLGSRLPGTSNSAPAWRNLINVDTLPWLKDHKVGDSTVFPAAGYIALALEAITQAQGSSMATKADVYTLRDVNISSAMLLQEGSDTELILDLHAVVGQQNAYKFVISTVSNGTWREHATGSVQLGDDSDTSKCSMNFN
jgi:acyl transferase domain-containing protein